MILYLLVSGLEENTCKVFVLFALVWLLTVIKKKKSLDMVNKNCKGDYNKNEIFFVFYMRKINVSSSFSRQRSGLNPDYYIEAAKGTNNLMWSL